jgi:hypothetical protein
VVFYAGGKWACTVGKHGLSECPEVSYVIESFRFDGQVLERIAMGYALTTWCRKSQ